MRPHYEREREQLENFRKVGMFPPWTDERMDLFMEPFRARRELVKQYAWAVPTDEALDVIVKHSPSGVVEIGAGTGYWAGLLRQRGLLVQAYDEKPHANEQAEAKWSPVEVGGPEKAALWPQLTLFLCWPPYDVPMAIECLHAYKGSTLVYIGEGESGCTGDDAFHKAIANKRKWKAVEEVSIPQWEGIHDYLQVYQRKV